jgi:urease accessory protein
MGPGPVAGATERGGMDRRLAMLDRPENRETDAAFPAELLIWLSPAFPVGAFAYSQGLETAVDRGWIADAATLGDWLAALTAHGALRNDLIILSLIRRAAGAPAIDAIAELSAALQPSRERAEEALIQGQAFLQAYRAGWSEREAQDIAVPTDAAVTLPVAVGLASRAHALPLPATLIAYATAFHTNLVSAAIRLGVIGQFDGQRVLAGLLPDLRAVCAFAADAAEDDLGSATFAADLASIGHETQGVRLFRS